MALNNQPATLGKLTAFKENPFPVNIVIDDTYTIVEPIGVEIWTDDVLQDDSTSATVTGQEIDFELSVEQLRQIESSKLYITSGAGGSKRYIFGAPLVTTMDPFIPIPNTEVYQVNEIGQVRVSVWSDAVNALIAQDQANIAITQAGIATAAANDAYDYMVEAQNASVGVADPAGTFNASTGVATQEASATNPAETFTPTAVSNKPKGYFLTVTVAGDTSISGTTVSAEKGDTFRSNGVGFGWTHIPASDAALEKVEEYEAKIILTEDGRFLIKGDGDWIGLELTAAGVTRTGPIEVKSIKIDGELLDVTQLTEKAVFDQLSSNFGLVEDGEFKFVDQYGNCSGIISAAGLWTLANLAANAITSKQVTAERLTAAGLIFQNGNPDYQLVITDELGNIGLDLTPKVPRIIGQQYDVNHAIWYGQSNAHQQGTTPVTTTSTPFVLTFTLGPYIYPFLSDPTALDSFRDSTENYYETPCTPAGKMIKQMINSRGVTINGTSFVSDTLVSASSRGGWSLTNLSKGTEDYNRLLATVTSGKSLANAQGKTYGVTCINWMQGEYENTSGMPAYQYKDLLRKLRIDLNTDIKAITGQKQEIFFLLWQCASFNMNAGYADISLAMLEMALNEDFFFMGPTMYPYRYATDQIHFHTDGQEGAKIGSYQGYLIDLIQNLGNDWLPIHVKETRISGSMLDVQFHVPVKPLVLDTVAVTDPGNKGFRLFNSTGSEQTITEARLVRPDTVRIVSSATILPGMKLTYALNGDANKSGWNAGARGCLRDSQGETIIYDPSGRNIKLHNWCPIFSHILK